MANVIKNKKTGYTHALVIEASNEEIEAGLNEAFKRLVKTAKVAGFRQGKVPRKVFEQNYGKEIISQEGIPTIINDAYAAAVQELDLHVVDYPRDVKVDEYKDAEKLQFSCEVDVEPEVKLGKYKGLKATKEPETGSDEDAQKQLNDLLQNYAEYQESEDGKAAEGDILLVNMLTKIGEEAYAAWTRDGVGVNLGSGMFGADFDNELAGAKKDQKLTFSIDFEEAFATKEVAGKTVNFEVEVKEVRKKQLPELTDEFVAKLGDFKTAEELKSKIRENLDAEAKQTSENKLVDALLTQIIEDMKVDIPEGMIKQELDNTLNQFKNQIKQQTGLEFSKYLEIIGKTEDAIKEEWKSDAEKRVKSELAIKAIGEKEKLAPVDADYDAEIKKLGMKEIETYEAFKASQFAGNLPYLESMVKRSKILNFIKESAKIKAA